MKSALFSVLLMMTLGAGSALAQTPSDLTCDDFRPTAEALAKYPDLKGACGGFRDPQSGQNARTGDEPDQMEEPR